MIIGCENCGLRIRGDYSLVVFGLSFRRGKHPLAERPGFCDGCGAAHPWATREERIFELENIVDEDAIDEADRVFIHDRLRELREAEGLDDKRERLLWTQIRDRSSKFLLSPPVMKITETLITAALRRDLKI
jgi:hypothetical protein